MVRRLLNRSSLYRSLGALLLSAGIMLGCFVSCRVVHETLDRQIARRSKYLVLAGTPVFKLPAATSTPIPTETPLPTSTPTSVPTPTPPPLPAVRVVIPSIGLNVPIEETQPVVRYTWDGGQKHVWDVPSFAVGHYNTSGHPEEGKNIVLVGHNNTHGSVFRHLYGLDVGDDVILFTAEEEFHYHVQEKVVIQYLGAEKEAEAKLRSYTAPKPTERVTLISCWPYATNAYRIVVVAVPSF
jgi:sortase A